MSLVCRLVHPTRRISRFCCLVSLSRRVSDQQFSVSKVVTSVAHRIINKSRTMFMIAADSDIEEEELQKVAKKIERKLRKYNCSNASRSDDCFASNKRRKLDNLTPESYNKSKQLISENGLETVSFKSTNQKLAHSKLSNEITSIKKSRSQPQLSSLDYEDQSLVTIETNDSLSLDFVVESEKFSKGSKEKHLFKKSSLRKSFSQPSLCSESTTDKEKQNSRHSKTLSPTGASKDISIPSKVVYKYVTVDGQRRKLTKRLQRLLDRKQRDIERKLAFKARMRAKNKNSSTSACVDSGDICHTCQKIRGVPKTIVNALQSSCRRINSGNTFGLTYDGFNRMLSSCVQSENLLGRRYFSKHTKDSYGNDDDKAERRGNTADDEIRDGDVNCSDKESATLHSLGIELEKTATAADKNDNSSIQNQPTDGKNPEGKTKDDVLVSENLDNYCMCELPNDEIDAMLPKPDQYVALDCEFVGVIPDDISALGRVSVVNYEGEIIYDVFSKPAKPIFNYRTQYSGIKPVNLKYGIPFEVAQRNVLNHIKGKIVIGHAIENDFKVLKIKHPGGMIRDTSTYKRLHQMASEEGSPRRSLKVLAKSLLGIRIQEGSHCSVEDARVSMELFKLVRHGWERNIVLKALMNPKDKDTEKTSNVESQCTEKGDETVGQPKEEKSLLDDEFWPTNLN